MVYSIWSLYLLESYLLILFYLPFYRKREEGRRQNERRVQENDGNDDYVKFIQQFIWYNFKLVDISINYCFNHFSASNHLKNETISSAVVFNKIYIDNI